MNKHRILTTASAFIVACASIASCSNPAPQSFSRVANTNVEAGFVAVGADFGRYDRLSAEEMGIYFPSHSAPSAEDQQRARDIFRQAFMTELEGYDVVRGEQGPTTLLVQASLLDFTQATTADVMAVRRQIRDIARPGSIIFIMELRDSMTGEVLGRAVDSADVPPISASADVATDWQAVEAAAGRWATLFRNFIDENLNR